ncbi:HepT-like ribonuclease domain-containing protein [Thiococcus pfennigii]|uniref:HepT-like ribonuclease domain-containing protein n=1 Tax=Thiococcus pfennigii TaxID=1057 RepID=UPI0019052C48
MTGRSIWPLYLADIVEHGERVARLLRGREWDDFEEDEVLRQAILFSLLAIGEATKQIPRSLREAEPTVNWRGAAGLRDIIVHQYFGLDTEILWDAASVHGPRLLDAARRLQDGLDRRPAE